MQIREPNSPNRLAMKTKQLQSNKDFLAVSASAGKTEMKRKLSDNFGKRQSAAVEGQDVIAEMDETEDYAGISGGNSDI